MKLPNLEVRKSTESQNLEEKADDIIQDAYSAVKEAIVEELDLSMEHPAPSAVYIYADDAGITLHHGDGPASFRLEGKDVDRQEFIEGTSEELRQKLTKAIGIYAAVDDAQNSFVSGEVLQRRYA